MAGATDFKIDVGLPHAPAGIVQPAAALDTSGVNAGSLAMQGFGAALSDVGAKIKRGQEQTAVAVSTTNYLTQLDALEQEHAKDPDFQNAPGNFATKQRELETELSAQIPDGALRQRAVLEWRRAGLSAGKRVQATAWTREVDANVASLDSQEAEAVRSAAAAATPLERAAAVNRYGGAVMAGTTSGWISEQEAVKRSKRFAQTLDLSDAMELTRSDPARASALLEDPKQYPNLDPLQRQHLKNTAQSAADIKGQIIVANGAHFNPAGAALTVGTVTSPGHARSVFDRVTIPIESDGDAAAVSSKGAIGLTQIMPQTAREVAGRLGMADVAKLDDVALTARLKSDKALNYQLGLTYWNEMATRYGGNLPATFAAYNAGPSRADAWVKKAVEQFGPGFTPAQFRQVVDIKETQNYLDKAWKIAGADVNGAGLSPEGRLRTASAVGASHNTDESDRIRIVKEEARADRVLQDPAGIAKLGNTPDPAQTALWVTRQRDAALAGDVEAAKALREYQFRESLRPMVRQAYATPPAVLDQTIAAEEARQAQGPVATDDKNRLDALREVRDEVKKRAHAEPVALLSRAGLAPAVSIDLQAPPEDAKFRTALAQRGAQAISAQQLYHGSANALMGEEARALKERYAAAGADEQFRMLSAFGATLQGRAYEDTVAAVAGTDGVALTVGRIAVTRPDLAREVLVGAKLLGTKEITAKADVIRPALQATLGTQIYPSVDMQSDVVTAAIALYTARRGANGLYDAADSGGIEKAVTDITGPIVKRNGRRTPIAPGISPDAFRMAIDHLSDRDVTLMGGAYGHNARPIAGVELADRAQFVPMAPGSPMYSVQMPTPDGKGAPVLTYDGTPLVVDMRRLVGQVQVPLTPYQRGRAAARGAAWERMRQANEEANE